MLKNRFQTADLRIQFGNCVWQCTILYENLNRQSRMRRSIWQWVILLVLSVILSVTETTADELSDYGVSEISEINNYVNQQHIEANKVAEAYNKYRTLSEEEFSIWKAQQEKEYAEFKNSIVNLWHKFEEPTNKDWVEYSKDKKILQ